MAHDATTLNIAAIVERQARLTPDRPAVVLGDRRLTYAQLDALICRVANALAALGIRRGDHVALSCPNVPYFPMAYYGIARLGAVVVPLNVLFRPKEIAYHLKDSDAKAYLCFEGTSELPMGQMGKAGFDEVDGCAHLVLLTTNPEAPSPIPDVPTLMQLVASQPATREMQATRPDDTAVMLYTSGTTGQPKGAELSHLNIVLNATSSRDLLGAELSRDASVPDVSLVTLPLFHSFGQVAQMNAHFVGGQTMVLLPRFEPAAVLETMAREKVNFWAGVPTMHWGLLQHVKAQSVDVKPISRNLKLVLSGGAPMPVETMKEFEETFGVRVLEGYGLSETSPVATFNHLERPSKPGTVGQAIFGVEVRAVDEQDRPVAVGEVGEIVIRGPNIMKGYYKRAEATAEAMRNGWFHTGDLGTVDADGYVSIVDRKKDMILRGGFNVYPRELEEELVAHPAVSLCAVIGVPDARLGEEIKAFVVRKPGATASAEDLIAWCRDRFAAYKCPRSIEFRDQLPMSATGKILKRELRDQVTAHSTGAS